MTNANWTDAVRAYLTRLEAVVVDLATALDAVEATVAAGNFDALTPPAAATAEASQKLESLLDQRSELLAATADGRGRPQRSLRAALRVLDEAELLEHCERVAAEIERQRERTISSFVTQFHLLETSQQLIRLLTRSPRSAPNTYGRQPASTGGGLFNEAA